MRSMMLVLALAGFSSACGEGAWVDACDDVADDATALANCVDASFTQLRGQVDDCYAEDVDADVLAGLDPDGPAPEDGPQEGPPCELGPDGRRAHEGEGPPEGMEACDRDDTDVPPAGDEVGQAPPPRDGPPSDAGPDTERPPRDGMGTCRPPLREVCAGLPDDAPARLVEACARLEAAHEELDGIRARTHERVHGAPGERERREAAQDGLADAASVSTCDPAVPTP